MKKKTAAEKKTKRYLKFRIVKSCIAAAIALTIITLGIAVAWFSSNTEDELTSFAMRSETQPFELRTYGNKSDFSAKLEKINSIYSKSGNDAENSDGKSGKETSVNAASLKWLTDSASEMSPGTSETFEFYVVPKRDGDLTVDFTAEMTAYSGSLTALGSDSRAAQLLKGHVILFLENDDGSLEMLDGGSFTKTFENAKAGEEYKVTLRRVWCYSFGQLVLSEGDENLRIRQPLFDSDSDGKAAIADMIRKYPERYFYTNGSAAFDDGGNMKAEYAAELEKMIGGEEYDQDMYLNLCSAYNNGDQQIGKKAAYLLLELNAVSGG